MVIEIVFPFFLFMERYRYSESVFFCFLFCWVNSVGVILTRHVIGEAMHSFFLLHEGIRVNLMSITSVDVLSAHARAMV